MRSTCEVSADTDVVSQYAKDQPNSQVDAWISGIEDADLYLSGFTIAEISFGVQLLPAGKRRNALQGWLNDDLPAQFLNRIVFFDFEIAHRYGELMANARRSGYSPTVLDGLIAATAAANGMAVATLNKQDFQRLGVQVVEF